MKNSRWAPPNDATSSVAVSPWPSGSFAIPDGLFSARSDGGEANTMPHSERRTMLIRTLVAVALVLAMLMPAVGALAGSILPKGFVYLREVDPTIVQDIRYAGSHNFVGRPIKGYLAAECILSEPAANALKAVQRKLTEKYLSLIVWDCYRPKRAVDDFLRWSRDPARTEMKAEFYPRTDKQSLFALGYLAVRSAHSRG